MLFRSAVVILAIATGVFCSPTLARWCDGARPTESDNLESGGSKANSSPVAGAGYDQDRPSIPLAQNAAGDLRLLWLADQWIRQWRLNQHAAELEPWVYLQGTETLVSDFHIAQQQLAIAEAWLMDELSGPSESRQRWAPLTVYQFNRLLDDAELRLLMLSEVARIGP